MSKMTLEQEEVRMDQDFSYPSSALLLFSSCLYNTDIHPCRTTCSIELSGRRKITAGVFAGYRHIQTLDIKECKAFSPEFDTFLQRITSNT